MSAVQMAAKRSHERKSAKLSSSRSRITACIRPILKARNRKMPDLNGLMSGERQGKDSSIGLPSRSGYAAGKEFWNRRFRTQDHDFDWYCTYKELSPHFVKHGVSRNAKILVVGCGTSNLSGDMFTDGYRNITNIDISDVVVSQMRERFPRMCWLEMDACRMQMFSSCSFDLVIDKATVDAFCCDQEGEKQCLSMLKEIHRVCKPGSLFLMISHAKYRDQLVYESLGLDSLRRARADTLRSRSYTHTFPIKPRSPNVEKEEEDLFRRSSGGWQTVDACKIELSKDAQLINFLKSKTAHLGDVKSGVMSSVLQMVIMKMGLHEKLFGSELKKELAQSDRRQKALEHAVYNEKSRDMSLEGSIVSKPNPGCSLSVKGSAATEAASEIATWGTIGKETHSGRNTSTIRQAFVWLYMLCKT